MKSFAVTRANTVHCYSEPVSMGKSFKGLIDIVEKKMKLKTMSKDLFLFFNKKRTYVKVLFWDGTGLCILAKKLPHMYYDLEAIEGNTVTLKEMQQCITVLQRKSPLLLEQK